MQIRIHRADGKTGSYSQDDTGRSEVLLARMDPDAIFSTGPIVVGQLNPFTVLNPDHVCWIEVRTELSTLRTLPPGIQKLRRLEGRDEFESMLAKQWPLWLRHKKSTTGDLLEALVEIAFIGGSAEYLHVTGQVTSHSLEEQIFGKPSICASFEPDGTLYINPKSVTRVRVYHSKTTIDYPHGVWTAEADEI